MRLPGLRSVEKMMGMPIIVDMRDDCEQELRARAVYAWFREVDERFEHLQGPRSEISRLNRGELTVRDLPRGRALGARPLR